MAIYKCSICGYVFDEEKEGRGFETLKECPICRQGADKFIKVSPDEAEETGGAGEKTGTVGEAGAGCEGADGMCADGQGLNSGRALDGGQG